VKPFALLVDYEVLDYIVRLRRRQGDAIRQRMLQIRDSPGNFADEMEADESGRLYHVHFFSGHAIQYWIDDADRQIKIMRLRPTIRP